MSKKKIKAYNQDKAWKELIKCYRQEDRDFYWFMVISGVLIGGFVFLFCYLLLSLLN